MFVIILIGGYFYMQYRTAALQAKAAADAAKAAQLAQDKANATTIITALVNQMGNAAATASSSDIATQAMKSGTNLGLADLKSLAEVAIVKAISAKKV